jgi:hypothetical protein
MAVALPLAGFDMYLDVSGCCLAVDGEDSILKIAAGGVTASARVDYVNLLTIVGSQFGNQIVVPDTGNQLFCNLCFHVVGKRLRVRVGKKIKLVSSISRLRLFLYRRLISKTGTLGDQGEQCCRGPPRFVHPRFPFADRLLAGA